MVWTVSGSRNDAFAPARRSVDALLPSTMINVRPRARPRTAGTAAWPSEIAPTPGTPSSAWVSVGACRRSRSPVVRSVAEAAGAVLMDGETPRTVTNWLSAASIDSVSSCASSIVVTRIGRATRPSRRTAITSIGSSGVISQRNRPAPSVLADPALADDRDLRATTGAPLAASTARPRTGAAGSDSANDSTANNHRKLRHGRASIRAIGKGPPCGIRAGWLGHINGRVWPRLPPAQPATIGNKARHL